jgi:hypothetical protein
MGGPTTGRWAPTLSLLLHHAGLIFFIDWELEYYPQLLSRHDFLNEIKTAFPSCRPDPTLPIDCRSVSLVRLSPFLIVVFVLVRFISCLFIYLLHALSISPCVLYSLSFAFTHTCFTHTPGIELYGKLGGYVA